MKKNTMHILLIGLAVLVAAAVVVYGFKRPSPQRGLLRLYTATEPDTNSVDTKKLSFEKTAYRLYYTRLDLTSKPKKAVFEEALGTAWATYIIPLEEKETYVIAYASWGVVRGTSVSTEAYIYKPGKAHELVTLTCHFYSCKGSVLVAGKNRTIDFVRENTIEINKENFSLIRALPGFEDVVYEVLH